MKAAILRAAQTPVEIADVPRPSPGPGEVLVRMQACGICHSDLFIAGLPQLPRAPLVLGHEGVGIVEALGPGVGAGLKPAPTVGDRVGIAFLHRTCGQCEFCLTGRETYCPGQVHTGYMVDGALAEYAVAAADYVARIPEGLSSLEAAPLCCAGLTAYRALRKATLRAGEWVAIFGAGGLGHLAIQLARHLGLRVAAVDVAPAKLEQAVRLGAELVINGAVQKPREALARVGGAAAALTLTGSGAAIEQAFQTLKPGGILVLVGITAETFALPVLKTVMQGLRIAGAFVGTRQELREVLELAAAGHLKVQVEPCGLEDVPTVLDRMKRGAILGRAVVEF